MSQNSTNFPNTQCNTSISNANASGLIAYDPYSWGNIMSVPEHSWAVTVTGGNGKELERQYWYDTAGLDYADDLSLGIDVCAFPHLHIPLNAHRLGQYDPGNCSTLFTQRCIDSLESVASESALKWVTYSLPPPNENLTAGVLPSICRRIMSDLQDTIENECGPQLRPDDENIGTFEYGTALTGHNSSTLYDENCTLSAGNKTLRPVDFGYPTWDTAGDTSYANITNSVTPILTVYMPVANVERGECCQPAHSVLECIRPSNFSEGSRVVPALTGGTPWPKPGLSAGAKGGVAAGVVVFVLAVGGLLLALWLAKRKKSAWAAAASATAQSPSDEDKKLPPELDGAFGLHELTPDDRKPELDGVTVSELGGGGGKPSELPDTSAPVELSAENAERGH